MGAPNPRPPTRTARQIPAQPSWVGWDAQSVRDAIEAHEQGLFQTSAPLVDWMGRDERISSTLGTRVRAVQGLPFRLEPNPNSKRPDFARMLAEEASRSWKRIAPRATQAEVRRSTALHGFAVGQLLWDTTGGQWTPQVELWDMRHLSWRWDLGCYQATALDGLELIHPGDGQWVVFSPNGLYRGWMHGSVRRLAILALLRQYALRDWGRASELYGMGVRLGYLPPDADPDDEERFLSQLVNLGAESVLLLAKGEDPQRDFDFDIKALDGAFSGELFEKLGQRCDRGITLELLGQQLTTEADGGSLALGKVQDKVRLDYLEADAEGDSEDWGTQVLYPWAVYNFAAEPEDVPIPVWDTEPPENKDVASKVLVQVGQALTALANLPDLGPSVDLLALAERFNLPLKPNSDPRLTPPAPAPPASPFGLTALRARFPSAVALLEQLDQEASGRPTVDQLGDEARAEGIEAIRPDVEALLAAIRGADSLEGVKAALSRVAGQLDPARFARVTERALVLASLHGRHAILEAGDA